MVALSATYLDDLGRIRLTASGLLANVQYQLQRSTALEPTWVDVRGGSFISSTGTTVVDDYEYTPNIENFYRLITPVISDTFTRNTGPGGLVVTGASSSFASTPDHASLDITGDIDMRAVITYNSYSSGVDQTIIGKFTTTGDQRSYLFRVNASGSLQGVFSLNGISTASATSTATLYDNGAVDGQLIAVRITRVSATGLITFYTGSEPVLQPTTWDTLGSTISGLSGSLFSGTAVLEVAAVSVGTLNRATGTVVMAQVRSGIGGTVVANPNFGANATGTLSFADSTGKTWTVGAAASIAGNDQAWGSAETGGLWTQYVDSGAGAVWEVINAGRTVTPSSTMTVYGRYLAGALTDINAQCDYVLPDIASSANDNAQMWLVVRGTTDRDDGYRAVLNIDASTSAATITMAGAGVVPTVSLPAWQPGQTWRIAMRVIDDAVMAKAWNTENAEPGTWQVSTTSVNWASGTVGVAVSVLTNDAVDVQFDNFIVFNEPVTAAATASITPVQLDTWLKSITYPLFNQILDCVDWDELSRNSRAGFFDIKGRHEILAITDVGSSASFNLSLVTRSRAENRALVALLTYGGVLLLQPPGDIEDECADDFSGIPGGYVVPSGSVQRHAIRGQAIWTWNVEFTRVAPSDADGIVPTTITWEQLWAIIGPEGTWEDVWATWPTWQALWQAVGSASTFNGGVLG